MVNVDLLWDELPHDLPPWTWRVLRPKLQLFALRCSEGSVKEFIRQELPVFVASLRSSLERLGAMPPLLSGELRLCQLAEVSAERAAEYQMEFHYLASPRLQGVHLGLSCSGRPPLCLLSFGPFDLDHLTPMLPFGIRSDQALVLTRQVTVGEVPPNTWSYTFGQACRWLRANRPNFKIVLTHLDTNLGFCGSSYLAANWFSFGTENKSRYVFVDSLPVTNRELIARFGSAKFDDLVPILGDRVCRTTCELAPLRLFAFLLQRRERRKVSQVTSFGRGYYG